MVANAVKVNTRALTVDPFCVDGASSRSLTTIRIEGRDVGDTPVAEKLARRWPVGHEFWR